jgi:hypothetical protein
MALKSAWLLDATRASSDSRNGQTASRPREPRRGDQRSGRSRFHRSPQRGSILAAAVLHASWNVTGIALAVTSVEGRALMALAVLVAGTVVAFVGSRREFGKRANPCQVTASGDVVPVVLGSGHWPSPRRRGLGRPELRVTPGCWYPWRTLSTALIGRNASRRAPQMGPTLKVAAAVALFVLGLTRSLWVTFVSTLLVATGWALSQVRRRLPGSFADGFFPYHSDDGWPRGVQEEYDVTWSSSGDPARSRSPGSGSGTQLLV